MVSILDVTVGHLGDVIKLGQCNNRLIEPDGVYFSKCILDVTVCIWS